MFASRADYVCKLPQIGVANGPWSMFKVTDPAFDGGGIWIAGDLKGF